MLEFEEIYKLTESKKPYLNGDDVLNAIHRGEILRKDLPEWIQEAIKPKKQQKNEKGEFIESDEDYKKRLEEDSSNLEYIKSECSKVCEMILDFFKNKNSVTPNEAISILLKKSTTKELLKSIPENSRDTLIEIADTGNSQNIKNIPEYKELIEKPYDAELWHDFEKASQNYKSSINNKRKKIDDSDISTLFDNGIWALYVPHTQPADSKIADGLIPFETKNRYNNTVITTKAQWCTAAQQGFYDGYSNDGKNKFYVIKHYDSEGKCDDAWQAAFSSSNHCEFMDKYDSRNFTFVLENAPKELLSCIVCDNENSKSFGMNLVDFKGYMDFFKGSVSKFRGDLLGYEDLLDSIIKIGKGFVDGFIQDFEKGVYDSNPDIRFQYLDTIDYLSGNFESYDKLRDAILSYNNAISTGEIFKNKEMDLFAYLTNKDICIEYSNFVKEGKLDPEFVSYGLYRREREHLDMLSYYNKSCKDGIISPNVIKFYDFQTSPNKCIEFTSLCNENKIDTSYITLDDYIDHPKMALDMSAYTNGKDLSAMNIFGEEKQEDEIRRHERELFSAYSAKPVVREYIQKVCMGDIDMNYVSFNFWKKHYKDEDAKKGAEEYSSKVYDALINPELIKLSTYIDTGCNVPLALKYQKLVTEGKINPELTPYKDTTTEDFMNYAVMFNDDIKAHKILPDSNFSEFAWHYRDISENKESTTWDIDYMYRYAELVNNGQIDPSIISMSDFKYDYKDDNNGEQDMINFCKAIKDGLINSDIKYDTYCSRKTGFTNLCIEYSKLVNSGDINREKTSPRDYAEYPEEAKMFAKALKDKTTQCTDFWNFRREVKDHMYDALVANGTLDSELVTNGDYEANPEATIDYVKKVRAGEIDPSLIGCCSGWGWRSRIGYADNMEAAVEYCKNVKAGLIKPSDMDFSYYAKNYKNIKAYNDLRNEGMIDPKVVTLKTFCDSETNRNAAVPYGKAVKDGLIDKKLVNFRDFCNYLAYNSETRKYDVNLSVNVAKEYCSIIKSTGLEANVRSNRNIKYQSYKRSQNYDKFEKYCKALASGEISPDTSLWDFEYKMGESVFKDIYKLAH